jgi:predicted aspartyl protease
MSAGNESVPFILQANRAASGGDRRSGQAALQCEYSYAGQGLAGKAWSIVDLKTGAFVCSRELGPLRDATGFDCINAWIRDTSGAVTLQAGGDKRALAVSAAYRHANLWWQPDRGGAEITALPRRVFGGAEFSVLMVTPQHGATFEAWFDAGSHLLSRVVEQQGFQLVSSITSEYENLEGAMIPHKIVIDRGSGEKFLQTLTLLNARFLQGDFRSVYAVRMVALEDCAIKGDSDQVVVPFSLIDNHIYVDVAVNGKGPFSFIVDTGANNILTPGTAKALGLTSEGCIETHGAAGPVSDSGVVRLSEIRIGDAVIMSQVVYVMPLPPVEVEGIACAGVIGFETFRRFVIRIDYAAGTIMFIRPDSFDPSDAGSVIELKFYGHMPEVEGTFEGRPCKLDIDTGSRAELSLTKPFVDANALCNDHPERVDAIDGWGINGPVRSRVIRSDGLRIGDVIVKDVVASMATEEHGALADAAYDGNIGSKLLKRFIVTFDYTRQRMYLKRSPRPANDTGSYDRAGLWINAAPDAFEVVGITPNGPAAAAGLNVGDRIFAVDAVPAGKIRLADLRLRLRNDPPGGLVTFTIGRGQARSSVALRLRNQI